MGHFAAIDFQSFLATVANQYYVEVLREYFDVLAASLTTQLQAKHYSGRFFYREDYEWTEAKEYVWGRSSNEY